MNMNNIEIRIKNLKDELRDEIHAIVSSSYDDYLNCNVNINNKKIIKITCYEQWRDEDEIRLYFGENLIDDYFELSSINNIDDLLLILKELTKNN